MSLFTLIPTSQKTNQSFSFSKGLRYEPLVRLDDDGQSLTRSLKDRKHLKKVPPRPTLHERKLAARLDDDKLHFARSDCFEDPEKPLLGGETGRLPSRMPLGAD